MAGEEEGCRVRKELENPEDLSSGGFKWCASCCLLALVPVLALVVPSKVQVLALLGWNFACQCCCVFWPHARGPNCKLVTLLLRGIVPVLTRECPPSPSSSD